MKILRKIIGKLHSDIYAMINCLNNDISSRIQVLSLELQERDKVISELQERDKIISELQERIKQITMEIQAQNAFINTRLNGMEPYFPLLRSSDEEIIANVNAIYSFCLNETVKRQTEIEKTEIYMYYRRLHELTTCYKIMNDKVGKCRVGRMHDGGYVMITPFSSCKIAYSIGICDDVSWDKEMAGYGYNVYQYDHTIDNLPEENVAFHWKKLGLTGLTETEELKRLDTIILDNGHEDCTGMLLKMDIEGYEWDLLCTCSQKTLNQFDQIVMEIHGLNDSCNFDKIIKGLERLMLSHAVVHIHGNNYRYATFCGDFITPDVLEITLIKKDLYNLDIRNTGYMSTIDQVNRPNSQDIWMGEW